jgi:hypothetical protein
VIAVNKLLLTQWKHRQAHTLKPLSTGRRHGCIHVQHSLQLCAAIDREATLHRTSRQVAISAACTSESLTLGADANRLSHSPETLKAMPCQQPCCSTMHHPQRPRIFSAMHGGSPTTAKPCLCHVWCHGSAKPHHESTWAPEQLPIHRKSKQSKQSQS